jgi:hypothetical protein
MILRVFPRRTSYTPTDEMAFVGNPPLFPHYAGITEIHVSVTFSWDVAEAERLAQAWQAQYPAARVQVGGPAMGDAGGEFVPGRYVREGVTFTSRGCPRRCPWCLVPEREGELRLLDPIAPGWVINDNNFAACPPEHRLRVYRMLREQRLAAEFRGGIDARLVTLEFAGEMKCEIRIHELFLACDTPASLPALQQAAERLAFLGREKLRCFVMVGYNDETPEQAEARLEAVWQAGCMPFAQFYRPPGAVTRSAASPEWRALVTRWSRPAATKALHREATL